ncbi:hypothetical protein MMC28_004210 [Mycoblastus sanguinarius]|nr:hypothetical protein [Mycoblastus sanguinarius]
MGLELEPEGLTSKQKITQIILLICWESFSAAEFRQLISQPLAAPAVPASIEKFHKVHVLIYSLDFSGAEHEQLRSRLAKIESDFRDEGEVSQSDHARQAMDNGDLDLLEAVYREALMDGVWAWGWEEFIEHLMGRREVDGNDRGIFSGKPVSTKDAVRGDWADDVD